jgi:hypothetical protein
MLVGAVGIEQTPHSKDPVFIGVATTAPRPIGTERYSTSEKVAKGAI